MLLVVFLSYRLLLAISRHYYLHVLGYILKPASCLTILLFVNISVHSLDAFEEQSG